MLHKTLIHQRNSGQITFQFIETFGCARRHLKLTESIQWSLTGTVPFTEIAAKPAQLF